MIKERDTEEMNDLGTTRTSSKSKMDQEIDKSVELLAQM